MMYKLVVILCIDLYCRIDLTLINVKHTRMDDGNGLLFREESKLGFKVEPTPCIQNSAYAYVYIYM